MGIHTSVKAQINVRRPTLSVETDAVHEENEATNTCSVDMNPTIPAALSVLERTMSMDSASSHGPSICDGNIPCLPMLSSAAKTMATNGTRTTAESPPPSDGAILSSPHFPGLKRFTFTDLRRATRSFHPDLLLGAGSLGCVFKGWVEENPLTAAHPARTSTVVAVKRIKKESFESNKDWLKEVDNLRKLHHQNLVKLIGYSIEDDCQLRVYEFMPGGNLHNCLFGENSDVQRLSWNLRMKIALGAATGLEFLHNCEALYVHGNFRTSKIHLDSNYDVKLCGYGLERCRRRKVILPWYEDRMYGPSDVDVYGHYVDAYTAPECSRINSDDHLTPASDVYSFGVVLLEILSGRRAKYNINEDTGVVTVVTKFTSKQVSSGAADHIFDTCIRGQYPKRGSRKALVLVTQCLQSKAKCRPNLNMVITVLKQLQSSS